MPGDTREIRRSILPVRVVRARPRLFSSLGVFVAIAAILSAVTTWRLSPRLLIGWNIGIGLYLVLAFHMMAGSDVVSIRRRAAAEDEGQFAMLVLTVLSALASLAAIIAELSSTMNGGARQATQLVLAITTIVLSWAFIHTMFALHYAHEFYDDEGGGGLSFPGPDAEPDYWDFMYFSFVIGMTSQVSDVGVTCKPIRRTVAAHGVVSFVFNVALLALTVNIAASAI
jgi:uncharacterized membrane protein